MLVVMLAACGRIGFPNGGSDDISGDGGGGDGASGDGGPLLDCTMTHPTATFCVTFEEPGMGDWDYTVLDEGSAELTTAREYRGSHSLEIQTTGVDAYKAARWGKNYVFDALDSGDLYLRQYVWLDSATTVNDQLSIAVIGNDQPPYPASNVLLVPGEIHANTQNGGGVADYEYPRDRWTCLLLHIDIGPNGAIEVFVDETRVVSRTGIDTRVGGGYTNVDVGVHYATPNQSASHMWIDEVVADTKPVGCN